MGSKKSTEKVHQVVTPTNPEWVTGAAQTLSDQIMGLGTRPPESYVAGFDPLQDQATAGAAGLGADRGWMQSLMGTTAPRVTASGVTASGVQGASLLDNLDAYMSPYTQQVVDTSLADYDFGAGQTRAQQALDMSREGAFGGSGSGIARAQTEDAILRGRGALSAGIRDQGFQVGAGLSSQDADRRQSASEATAQLAQQASMANAELGQQASTANAQAELQQRQLLASLGLDAEASGRANVGTQYDVGAANRGVEQSKLSAPLDLTAWQVAQNAGLPLELFRGETTDKTTTKKSSGGLLGTLGTLAMGLGSLGLAPFTGGLSLGGLAGLGGAGGLAGLAGGALGKVGIGNLGGAIGAITSGMGRR